LIARVSVVALMFSLSAAPAAASEEERVLEARRHFDQGMAFFERENYEAALAELGRAYTALGDDPKRAVILFNIAQCHERLFRYDAALEYYRRYLDEAGDAAEDRAEVEGTIRTLDALLATIEIKTNVPNAEVWIDERRIALPPGVIRIPGGRHVLELRAPGFVPARRELAVPARGSETVLMLLDEVREGLDPVYFWSSAAATGVALGVGALFGARALAARSDVDARSEDSREQYTVTAADQRDIRDLALAADLSYGVALVFGAGATILYFLTEWEDE
jgi:tetratricopeptide (TPR) repeat protein